MTGTSGVCGMTDERIVRFLKLLAAKENLNVESLLSKKIREYLAFHTEKLRKKVEEEFGQVLDDTRKENAKLNLELEQLEVELKVPNLAPEILEEKSNLREQLLEKIRENLKTEEYWEGEQRRNLDFINILESERM